MRNDFTELDLEISWTLDNKPLKNTWAIGEQSGPGKVQHVHYLIQNATFLEGKKREKNRWNLYSQQGKSTLRFCFQLVLFILPQEERPGKVIIASKICTQPFWIQTVMEELPWFLVAQIPAHSVVRARSGSRAVVSGESAFKVQRLQTWKFAQMIPLETSLMPTGLHRNHKATQEHPCSSPLCNAIYTDFSKSPTTSFT